MRLAISNIAWDVAQDEQVAQLLDRHAVDAIDVAPGKYFHDILNAKESDIKPVRAWWADRGIEITGMQSLLFGTTGLNIFGTTAVQKTMLDHLDAVCRIGTALGATRLVFGSPKNRDRSAYTDADTIDIATHFFSRLGDIAQHHGVVICLEPNPPCYGANFMTTSDETAHIVREVAHVAIKMQLDTGALAINNEDASVVLEKHADLIGHVHASEAELLPLGDAGADHVAVHSSLVKHLPHHIVSIEMLATKTEPHLVAIERALLVAKRSYRPSTSVP